MRQAVESLSRQASILFSENCKCGALIFEKANYLCAPIFELQHILYFSISDETYLSTFPPRPQEQARLSRAHGDQKRPQTHLAPPQAGPQETQRIRRTPPEIDPDCREQWRLAANRRHSLLIFKANVSHSRFGDGSRSFFAQTLPRHSMFLKHGMSGQKTAAENGCSRKIPGQPFFVFVKIFQPQRRFGGNSPCLNTFDNPFPASDFFNDNLFSNMKKGNWLASGDPILWSTAR